jgi:hypothetical protein
MYEIVEDGHKTNFNLKYKEIENVPHTHTRWNLPTSSLQQFVLYLNLLTFSHYYVTVAGLL